MKIRALLLAAGLGTRLKPITDKMPKCLVPIGKKPILTHWIAALKLIDCEKILINTHYLAEQVESAVNLNVNKNIIEILHEPELLGTAGTLLKNRRYFEDQIGLLIHADNYTTFDLNQLITAHIQRPKGCLLTMLTFTSKSPGQCGIIVSDKLGIVWEFHEKVKEPPGFIANGAIYAFGKDFLDFMENLEPKPKDISLDIIPKLMGKIYTLHTEECFIDIGTPEALNEARKHYKSIKSKKE